MTKIAGRVTFARILSGLYVVCLLAALAVLFLTRQHTPFAGIFFVVVTIPWPLVLEGIHKFFHVNTFVFNLVFLLMGGLVNAWILYWAASRIARFLKRAPKG